MKITKFIIRECKPLLHRGTLSIECDVVSSCIVIIGGNGCGKSTLVKQLTPIPPTKSLYTKNGYKELHIVHDGSEYVLISDFSKSTIHSFLRDGVELNASGNATIQKKLVYDEFRYTELVENVVNLECNISTMTPKEREVLFLETYPGNLNFITTKYTKLARKIRSSKDMLKMLNGRKVSLESKLLEKSNIDEMKNRKDILSDGVNILNTTLEIVEDYLQTHDKVETGLNLDTLADICFSYRYDINDYMEKYRSLSNLDITIAVTKQTLNSHKDRLGMIDNRLLELKEVIDSTEMEMVNDANVSLDELESELSNTLQKIQILGIEPTIPIVSPAELDRLNNEIYPRLKNVIEVTYGETYIEFSELERNLKLASNIKSNLEHQKTKLEESKQLLNKTLLRLSSEEQSKFPEECVLECPLKKHQLEVMKSLQEDRDQFTKIVNKICEELEASENQLKQLKSISLSTYTQKENIELVSNILNVSTWGKYVLNGKSLISILNEKPYNITNRLQKIIVNSQRKMELDELILKRENLKTKIEIVKKSKSKINSLMNDKILDMKTEHSKLLQERSKLTEFIHVDSMKLKQTRHMVDIHENLKSDIVKINNYMDRQITNLNINTLLEYKKLIHVDLKQFNTTIETLDAVLKEQFAIKDRLDNEVMVEISKINEDLEDLVKIEKQLSPKIGMPAEYVSCFINTLIDSVNNTISYVWGSDVRLEHVSDKNLDYTIKVVFEEGTHISDMKLCSTAQKAILDLAWTLALYEQLELSDHPIFLDEIDSGFSNGNRTRLLTLLNDLTNNDRISQLFIVNHHSSLYSAIVDKQIICINPEGIVLPPEYNQNVKID